MRLQLRLAGKADTDVMDGGDGTADVLKLSTGKHTFGDDDKLKNIEKIETTLRVLRLSCRLRRKR